MHGIHYNRGFLLYQEGILADTRLNSITRSTPNGRNLYNVSLNYGQSSRGGNLTDISADRSDNRIINSADSVTKGVCRNSEVLSRANRERVF